MYRFVGIICFLLIMIGCAKTYDKYTDPKDYVFKTERRNILWQYYLSLDDCAKVDFIDSIYRGTAVTDSISNVRSLIDTNLIEHSWTGENFYYWIFREILLITRHGPPGDYNDYLGFYCYDPNHQAAPGYDNFETFDNDIKKWKEILNCIDTTTTSK